MRASYSSNSFHQHNFDAFLQSLSLFIKPIVLVKRFLTASYISSRKLHYRVSRMPDMSNFEPLHCNHHIKLNLSILLLISEGPRTLRPCCETRISRPEGIDLRVRMGLPAMITANGGHPEPCKIYSSDVWLILPIAHIHLLA